MVSVQHRQHKSSVSSHLFTEKLKTLPPPPSPTPDSVKPTTTGEKDTVSVLKDKLSRFGPVNDRKNVLKALRECSYLRCVPLDQVPVELPEDEAWKELEKEVCQSSIEVNGIAIGPGSPASSSIEVQRILKGLCAKLSADLTGDHTKVYKNVVVRLAETTCRTDSFARLEPILSSGSIALQTPDVAAPLPVTNLTIYESGQCVHATCNQYLACGLYRKSDLSGGKPWLKLTFVVKERSNLSTGASVRTVEVRLPHK